MNEIELIENEIKLIDILTFSKLVMDKKTKDPYSNYLEILVELCEEIGIDDMSKIPDLLVPKLKQLIEDESEDLHLISKTRIRKLPL